MGKHRFGFTLIEVAIFLAVTGALFVAVTVGVQNSIYQQRFNDTVQNFADFLGNLYAEVANVQSSSNGRHDEAIYGKLVTFGEVLEDGSDNKQSIHVYDVIARAANSWDIANNDTLGLLKTLRANVAIRKSDGQYELVGMIEDYVPKWAARIQKTTAYEDFEGSILIIRNAKSGTIQTFSMDNPIDVRNRLESHFGNDELEIFTGSNEKSYLDMASDEHFRVGTIDFCVNPNGDGESSNRMDVRLIAGAHDASGVEIISFDSEDNKCRL